LVAAGQVFPERQDAGRTAAVVRPRSDSRTLSSQPFQHGDAGIVFIVPPDIVRNASFIIPDDQQQPLVFWHVLLSGAVDLNPLHLCDVDRDLARHLLSLYFMEENELQVFHTHECR
jgi:hypothetical protein